MPIQGLKFNIPTGTETHLGFQATGSFTAYNPNDGYTLIALDRTATLLDYDYKLPSQSGGHFPGPINSYLSMYFVDQSGAGLSGQVIVYASPDVLQIPQFWSIGRAIQSQVTSLDLIQGVQPPNPPANTSRLWVDANGHLHIAQSTGTDFTVIDSTNYATIISLGADMYGPVNAGHIGLQNASWISAYDTVGTRRNLLTLFSDNTVLELCAGGVSFRWANQANNVELMTLTNAGNLTIDSGNLLVGAGLVYLTDINHAIQNSGGNLIYLSGAGNQHFFWATGSPQAWASVNTGPLSVNGALQTTGLGTIGAGLNVTGAITATTTIGLPRGQRLIWGDSNTSILGDGSDANIYLDTWTTLFVRAQGYSAKQLARIVGPNGDLVMAGSLGAPAGGCAIGGNYTAQGVGSSGYAFQTANAAAAFGQGYANAWINASSQSFKKNIKPIGNPLGILLNPALRGVEYDHDWELEEIPDLREAVSGSSHHIGFVADAWLPHVPEIVAVDKDGVAEGMDYARVTALLWEGLREYIQITNDRLDKIEHAA